MAHWGGYWKVKLKHRRKRLCAYLERIDSFEMFKNKEFIKFYPELADEVVHWV